MMIDTLLSKSFKPLRPVKLEMNHKILDSFRGGLKDHASFWIQMHGKLLLISYYAVRDNDGKYRGTIEVTQDISEITKIKGEKRLLDWNET